MQVGKTCPVCREGENRARTRTATTIRCPIQSIAPWEQTGRGTRPIVHTCKAIQVCKTGTVGIEGKHCAVSENAAVLRRSIQSRLVPSSSTPASPSVAVKLCRFVKPVPFVLMANTVPLFAAPPRFAVPYSMSSDKTNPPYGFDPPGFKPPSTAKLCRFVKPVPSVLTANTVPIPDAPPEDAVP